MHHWAPMRVHHNQPMAFFMNRSFFYLGTCISSLAGALLMACLFLVPAARANEPVYQTLDNGIRIALFPDAQPDTQTSIDDGGDVVQIWLHLKAGSIDENDDQRGAAVVLKRASVFGTASMDESAIETLFALTGSDSSVGQGAFAHFDQTTFMLASPDARTTKVILGFYRDLLDGHQIDEPNFIRARDAVAGSARSTRDQWVPDLLSGFAPGERMPMPSAGTVDQLTLDAVNAFAERTYAPRNATILVVGDFDAALMRHQIAKSFGRIPARQVVPNPESFPVLAAHDRISVIESDDTEQTEVALLWFEPVDFGAMSAHEGVRRLVTETVAGELVRHRISTQVHRTLQGAQETDGSIVSMYSTVRIGQIAAGIESPDGWSETLRALVGQANRVALDPIGDGEFTRARRGSLLQWRADQDEWNQKTSRDKAFVCNWIISLGLDIDPARWADRASSILATITNDEIHSTIKRLFDPSKSNLVIITPMGNALDLEPVRSAFDASKSIRLDALAPDWVDTSVPPIVSGPPPGGKITEVSQHPPSGIWTAKLGNGIVVRQRSMVDPANRAQIRVTLHHAIDDAALRSAALSGWRVPSTTRLSPEDIRGILAEFAMTIEVSDTPEYAQLVVTTPSEHLERGIELAWVLLNEPEVDEQAFQKWVQNPHRGRWTGSPSMLDNAIDAYAESMGLGPDLRTDSGSITIQRAARAMHELTRSSPIEMAIVGEADAEAILDLSAAFFGSLRPRTRPRLIPAPAMNAPLITPERVLKLTVTNPDLAGTVVGLVACPTTDLQRVRAMIVAAMVLNEQIDELGEQGRVPQGGGVHVYFDEQFSGQMLLLASVPGQPTEDIGDQLEQLLARFAETPITAEQLAVHADLIERTLEPQMATAQFWASRLASLDASGYTIDDIWLIREAYLGLTPESLRRAFARAYTNGPHMHIETTFEQ